MIQAANTIQQYVRGGGGGGGGGGFVQTSGICPQIHYGGLAGIIPSSVDLSGNVIRFVTTQYTGGVGGAGANGIFIEANSMYIKTITAIGSVAGANDVAYAGGGGGGGGGSVILTYSSTGTYSAGTVTQTGGAGGTAGLYAGNGKNGALGTTNTFIYTQGSPAIPFVPFPGGGYTAPTLATCGTPTNTIVDVGQYVSETCTWTVGSLADAVTQNAFSSTNLANTMMTNTIASTSSGSVTNTFQVNSLFISPNSPFAFNIIVTDAHPTTINSVPSATVTIYSALSANPITAANNIYQGYSVGPATIRLNAAGGAPTLKYNWFSYDGTLSPICNNANVISGQTGSTLNINSYLAATGITTFSYNAVDGATTNSVACSAGYTVDDPTISSFPPFPANAAVGQNNVTFMATWVAIPGTSTYVANYMIYNSVTGAFVTNQLYTGIASSTTSNSWQWTIGSTYGGNTFKVNVVIGNSISGSQAVSTYISALNVLATTPTFSCTSPISSTTFLNGLEYQDSDTGNVFTIYTAPSNAYTVNAVWGLMAPTAPSTATIPLLNDSISSTTMIVPQAWYFQYNYYIANTPTFKEVCTPVLTAGTGLKVAGAYSNTWSLLPLTQGTGITVTSTNNIANAGVLSLTGSGGWAVSASTGAITGYSPTYTASTGLALSTANVFTLLGLTAGTGITVTSTNTVALTPLTGGTGISITSTNNIAMLSLTAGAGIGITSTNTVAMLPLIGENGIYIKATNTIGINAIAPLSNVLNALQCSTCYTGSNYNSVYAGILTSFYPYNNIASGTGIVISGGNTITATGYNSVYAGYTNYNSAYLTNIYTQNGIWNSISGQTVTVGINSISPLTNTLGLGCATCYTGSNYNSVYASILTSFFPYNNIASGAGIVVSGGNTITATGYNSLYWTGTNYNSVYAGYTNYNSAYWTGSNYNSLYWTGTNYNSFYIGGLIGENGIYIKSGNTLGVNVVAPMTNTVNSIGCATCWTGTNYNSVYAGYSNYNSAYLTGVTQGTGIVVSGSAPSPTVTATGYNSVYWTGSNYNSLYWTGTNYNSVYNGFTNYNSAYLTYAPTYSVNAPLSMNAYNGISLDWNSFNLSLDVNNHLTTNGKLGGGAGTTYSAGTGLSLSASNMFSLLPLIGENGIYTTSTNVIGINVIFPITNTSNGIGCSGCGGSSSLSFNAPLRETGGIVYLDKNSLTLALDAINALTAINTGGDLTNSYLPIFTPPLSTYSNNATILLALGMIMFILMIINTLGIIRIGKGTFIEGIINFVLAFASLILLLFSGFYTDTLSAAQYVVNTPTNQITIKALGSLTQPLASIPLILAIVVLFGFIDAIIGGISVYLFWLAYRKEKKVKITKEASK